jgi:hypothetical protein
MKLDQIAVAGMPGTARNDNSVSNKELGNGCGIQNSMNKVLAKFEIDTLGLCLRVVSDTTDTAGTNKNVPDIELSVQPKQGFGTENGVDQVLATKPRTNLQSMNEEKVTKPGTQTPVKRIRELRLGTAGLALGLATGTKLKFDEDDVVRRTVKSMKNVCDLPKTPSFKPNKKNCETHYRGEGLLLPCHFLTSIQQVIKSHSRVISQTSLNSILKYLKSKTEVS